jgi:hypothetical protein
MPASFLLNHLRWLGFFWGVAVFGTAINTHAEESPWKDLQEQNRILRGQLQAQQGQLDELRAQMDRLTAARTSASSEQAGDSAPTSRDSPDRKLVISGEVGIAFLSSSKDGQYPNQEFRIDDANLHIEAAIANNIYFFGELQLAKREALEEDFYLGEFYIEFENISGALGAPDRLINLRFGRVDIPFGEEYQQRDPLANPLVTHSLSDVWGTDEGIELYGELGHASYAFALQNGSSKRMHDFNADKSLSLRVGFDLTSKFHLSASAMRTGKLNSAKEPLSEVWLGNNVFRNIGSSFSTTHQADLAELDAAYTWSNGHFLGAAGGARYRDNDPLVDQTRHFTYYQAELVQSLTAHLYGALRFSTLRVDHGYPLTGIGNFNKYFLGQLLTKSLQRLTLGGGYRVNRSLVMKLEYTREDGQLTTGQPRDNHMLSYETALGF